MIERKIKTAYQLRKIIASLKRCGKRIVFTNGCFDVLHYGHVKYLQQAKNKGDVLIVGVNSDSSVKKIKGNMRPIVPQRQRMRVVAALESVDFVAVFKQPTPIKLIKSLKPDILIKGGDWKTKAIVGSEFVKSYGGKTITIPFVRGLSTSNLIEKIAKVK